MEKLRREVAALRAELDGLKRALLPLAPLIRQMEAEKRQLREDKKAQKLERRWDKALEGLGVRRLRVYHGFWRMACEHPFPKATHVFVPYCSPCAKYGLQDVGVELTPNGTWGDLLKAADRSCDKVQALVTRTQSCETML